MLIHIVRHNEKLSDILTNYNVAYDELKVNNLHISNLSQLVGGMKLKIPFLSSETLQILESTEPFISDYYPSVNKLDNIDPPNEEEKPTEEQLIEQIQDFKEVVNPPEVNEIKYPVNDYYSNQSYSRRSIYPFYKKEKS